MIKECNMSPRETEIFFAELTGTASPCRPFVELKLIYHYIYVTGNLSNPAMSKMPRQFKICIKHKFVLFYRLPGALG